jgi:hypothetical protein
LSGTQNVTETGNSDASPKILRCEWKKYPASHLRLFVSAMRADDDCLSST